MAFQNPDDLIVVPTRVPELDRGAYRIRNDFEEVLQARVVALLAGAELHEQDGTLVAQFLPAGRDALQPLLGRGQLLRMRQRPRSLDRQPEPVR
jgi:hypothetical protein